VPAGGLGEPYTDYDGSRFCYFTGLGYGVGVRLGSTILYSPVINLTGGASRLEYARWYDNVIFSELPDDVFLVQLSPDSGSSWVILEELGPDGYAEGEWETALFWMQDFIPSATSIQLKFVASDPEANSHVEAAVDAVSIVEYICDPLILTESIPDATVDEPYTHQLIAVGGEGDLIWSDQFDDLSGTGLSLSSTGHLCGVPAIIGDLEFTASAIDSMGASDERLLSISVQAGLVCGDIDNSSEGPDISDLVYLVDYMFTNGPPPPVMQAADVDGSGGDIDISDLVYLVDFMFTGGSPPNCS
jgi:hypothetical protein